MVSKTPNTPNWSTMAEEAITQKVWDLRSKSVALAYHLNTSTEQNLAHGSYIFVYTPMYKKELPCALFPYVDVLTCFAWVFIVLVCFTLIKNTLKMWNVKWANLCQNLFSMGLWSNTLILLSKKETSFCDHGRFSFLSYYQIGVVSWISRLCSKECTRKCLVFLWTTHSV